MVVGVRERIKIDRKDEGGGEGGVSKEDMFGERVVEDNRGVCK